MTSAMIEAKKGREEQLRILEDFMGGNEVSFKNHWGGKPFTAAFNPDSSHFGFQSHFLAPAWVTCSFENVSEDENVAGFHYRRTLVERLTEQNRMRTSQKVVTGGFIQPLSSCCCGVNLDFGIKMIIMLHSLSSFFYIYTCTANILLDRPTFGANVDLYTQTFNCAWALASIPFIASGISGITYHCEVHLRMYLYWLMLTMTTDLALTGVYLTKTVCKKLPTFLEGEGGAFACGTMRMTSIAFLGLLFCFAAYFVFIIWSRCEELQDSGSETSFDILIGETRARQKRQIYQHKSGLFGTGLPLPSNGVPIMYGSLASPGIGGGGKIFSGTRHITEFPPPVEPHHGNGQNSFG